MFIHFNFTCRTGQKFCPFAVGRHISLFPCCDHGIELLLSTYYFFFVNFNEFLFVGVHVDQTVNL